MPTPSSARQSIFDRMRNSFSLKLTGEPKRLTLDNQKFKEPDFGEWVRLVVRHSGREQETLGGTGNRRFQSDASVVAQVFTDQSFAAPERPEDLLVRADELAKEISDLFGSTSFDGLAFQAASSREAGQDGKWFLNVVEVPFTYEDIR